MHPELDLPGIGVVHAYGTAIGVAVLVGGALAVHGVRRLADVPRARALLAVACLVVAAVIGAALGGWHMSGGLLGVAVALPLAARVVAMPIAVLADALAPGTAATFGLARLGCFLHGCCFGRSGSWPWCFGYPRGTAPFSYLGETGAVARDAAATMPLHPLPLYFVGCGLVVAAFAAWHVGRRRFAGETALATTTALSVAMALLEPFRASLATRVYWGPLPQLLWTAIAMSAVALGAWAWAEWRHRPRISRRQASFGV